MTWIEWLLKHEGHEFLVNVDMKFLNNQFNQIDLHFADSELRVSKSRLVQCLTLMNRKYAPTEAELQNE